MALTIDTTALARSVPQRLQEYLEYITGDTSRFEIFRVCGHATVFHDAPRLSALKRQVVARREALDWQANHNEDLDEVQVFQQLKQQAEMAPWLAAFTETQRTNATTLVASCAFQSPSLIASIQQGLLSSYQRYFFRFSLLSDTITDLIPRSLTSDTDTDLIPRSLTSDTDTDLIPHSLIFDTDTDNFDFRLQCVILSSCSSSRGIVEPPEASGWWPTRLRITEASLSQRRRRPLVAWHVQYDIVDLLSRRSTPTLGVVERARSILNSLHRVSSSPFVEDTSLGGNHLLEAEPFKGVRYRRDRRTWTAEMKPPKYKKKEYFGEFKSQIQAARVVDVAYYYYGKTGFLNFLDTPHLLSTMPLPEGLGVEDMLRFVKKQAKWVSTIASTLPTSTARVTSAIPHPSFRRCQADNSNKFGSFSELASYLSCGDADEADNGTSQPQSSMQLDSMANNDWREPNLVTADGCGFVSSTFQEQHGVLQCSSEGGFAARRSSSSSVRITDGWDGAEHLSAPALTNFVTPSQPSWEWVDTLLMSPPADGTPVPPSPSDF